MSARLLAVEDNAILARPLIRFLSRLGYEVHSVESCRSARALGRTFDLGVFDVELRDGSGIDLCRELLARGDVRAAIFYTGTIDGALLRQAASVAPVVRKTDSADALRQAICTGLAQISDGDVAGCCSGRRGA